MGGVYTAWRLTSSGAFSSDQVKMFERTDYIGGRLLSPRIGCEGGSSADDNQLPRAELGGMRIRAEDHIIQGVVSELGIPVGPFHMNHDTWPDAGKDAPDSPVWCRGFMAERQQYKALWAAGGGLRSSGTQTAVNSNAEAQAAPVWTGVLPFVLNETSPITGVTTVGDDPDVLLGGEFASRRLSEPVPCDSAAWIAKLEETGGGFGPEQRLRKWQQSTWDDFYHGKFSPEADDLEQCLSGYYNERNGMSLGQPETIDSDKYMRPLKGMQSVPLAIHEAFSGVGGETQMNAQLLRVERDGREDYPFTLTFGDTFTSPCSGITTLTGGQFVVKARRVVLGLTKTALEKVGFDERLADGRRSSRIQSTVDSLLIHVGGWKYAKVFAAFNSRFWWLPCLVRHSPGPAHSPHPITTPIPPTPGSRCPASTSPSGG